MINTSFGRWFYIEKGGCIMKAEKWQKVASYQEKLGANTVADLLKIALGQATAKA